ncbi:vomeronasal type-2 receptor 26-like [Protopterus annectens]|uniref:vomeronasal type-2 receptor 26-like n=1 Tax=Protopterus annectens TaxID=7888 RepID=UPI001CF9F0CA|nr:vomeronasal type-2 receptor 26-like [Protopterus annectens]
MKYSTGCLSCPFEEWPNEMRDKCIQRDIEFLSYNDPMSIALTSITVMGSLLTAAILIIFIRFNDTPIVKANNRNLSYLLLITLMLCFLCSFIFMGYPNVLTCRLRQAVFGISFVLSVSCVLAKTIMVVVAFNATKPNSKFKGWVGPQLSYTLVSLSTLVQLIICVTWIACSSPFPERNFKSQPGLIIIECNEGSAIAFWCMLGYMGILAAICFLVAFLSRNLPDSFNEAKFISFSMVVFVSVWLGFIPAYLSTKGKYMVAVEIFAIIASSAGLLVCIFFPKCFIILFRPNLNSKTYLKTRGTQNR